MQLSKRIVGLFALVALVVLAGCATGIPPDKLREYGLIQPGHKWSISKIDGEKFPAQVGTPRNVLPGKHTVVESACPTPNSCNYVVMTFEVRAGLTYDLDNMRVSDRFTNNPVGSLYRTSGSDYVFRAIGQ